MTVLLIDPGLGNLGSICASLELIRLDYEIETNYRIDKDYTKYKSFVLPGVGSFPYGMEKLKSSGLDKLIFYLNSINLRGLGICLGLQIFMDSSTESSVSETKGLGLFKGDVVALNYEDGWTPNVGWIPTEFLKSIDQHHKINFSTDFYYTHSYHVRPKNPKNILCKSFHGKKDIVTGLWDKNLFGIQFHPEKSHDDGLILLRSILSPS